MGDSSKPSERNQHVNRQSERRVVVRVECDKTIGHTAKDSVTFFEGRVLDVSANGIGMRVRRKLEAGNTISIILKKEGAYQSQHCAKVIHVRPEETGSWSVGCEFGDPLSPEQLRAFQAD